MIDRSCNILRKDLSLLGLMHLGIEMKILKSVNTAVDRTVTFILKVLGAFGACWGSFSAPSVAYREFFGGSEDVDFMSNSTYARTALSVSLSAATLSAYIIVRDKLNAHYAKEKTKEVDVTIPICHSFDQAKLNRELEGRGIEMDAVVEGGCKDGPRQVVCREKYE